MQSWQLGGAGRQTVVGSYMKADLAPYSQPVYDLVTSMLRHVLKRPSADELLQLPILRQLPNL